MNRYLLGATACIMAASSVAAQTDTTTLLFGFDSASLTPRHEQLLDGAAADFRTSGSASISIVGHADSVGTPEYNRALSERRARAVSDALRRRGVPETAIVAAWRGEEDPAVQTADGVREPANRRVTIDVAEADVTPAPTPVAPVAAVDERKKFRFIVAPFGAYNNQPGDDSYFAGLNLTASYDLTPNLVISAEQAGFYSFGADDDGFGGRTAAGLDVQINQLGGFLPYVGGNVGYTYVDGSSEGGLFVGPEVGLRFGGFEMKVAYDIYVDEDGRDIGDGVVAATLGYGFRF